MNRRRFLSRLPAVAAIPLNTAAARAGQIFPISAEGASVSATPDANKAAFTRALHRAKAAGGDVLIDGRYRTANLIVDGMDGVGIIGLERGRSALIGGHGDDALLSVVRSRDVVVSGVELRTEGVAALYALTSEALAIRDVQTWGGRMAGLFLDRCLAPVLSGVTVRDVTLNGAVGGCGIWIMRGGSGARLSNILIEGVDGDGLRIDSSSRDGLPSVQCLGAAVMGLMVSAAGRITTNAAAVILEGASNTTISSIMVDGVGTSSRPGHGIVMQQDQSGDIPSGNVVTATIIRRVTGYAVALLGAQYNSLSFSSWDGAGAGPLLSARGLGGLGAPSEANRIDIADGSRR